MSFIMETRENTTYIKTQKFTDFEKLLIEKFGERFADYRVNYKKSLNYDQNGYVPDFPITVSIELINRCNLSCIMCYTINHYGAKSAITREQVEKISEELKKYNTPAAVLGMGSEALVYKDIDYVMNKIYESGVMDFFFGTNGVLLTEEFMETMVINQLSRLEISLDAAKPETYKKIRGKDELLRIEKNIDTMLKLKKKHNSKLPVIRLSFCVQELNKNEMKEFREKWSGKVDYVDFQQEMNLSYVDEVRHGNYENALKIKPEMLKNTHCAYPFNSLSVWANGDVTPCCTFYGMGLVMGNINHQTLKEIWDGDQIKEVREGLLSGKPLPPCSMCLYHRDDNNFEKVTTVNKV